ncbi:MAG: OmpW family outer membrane protein, partial [Pseudomonadota bacterium]
MKTFQVAAACGLAALPALIATPAAAEAGDWLIRARAIMIAPNESSTGVLPAFPGGEVSVDNAIMPELDFTYFITNNIATELILATTNHDISGEMDLAGLGEIADTWVLPPTLTLQYHFLPDAAVRP